MGSDIVFLVYFQQFIDLLSRHTPGAQQGGHLQAIYPVDGSVTGTPGTLGNGRAGKKEVQGNQYVQDTSHISEQV